MDIPHQTRFDKEFVDVVSLFQKSGGVVFHSPILQKVHLTFRNTIWVICLEKNTVSGDSLLDVELSNDVFLEDEKIYLSANLLQAIFDISIGSQQTEVPQPAAVSQPRPGVQTDSPVPRIPVSDPAPEGPGISLTHFYHRFEPYSAKLTFKFSGSASWRDVTHDQNYIILEVDRAVNRLEKDIDLVDIGPFSRVIVQPLENRMHILIELNEPVEYDMYDEAGGTLVSVILRNSFPALPTVPTQLFSFDFRDADVRDVLLALAKAAGVNIVVDDTVTGTLTLSFQDLTFDQALGYILQVRGLGQVKLGNNIIVGERNALERNFGLLRTERFPLKFISPERAGAALSLFIPPDRIIEDDASRSLIIKGRAEDFREVRRTLDNIDQALETRVFTLQQNLYEDRDQLDRIVDLVRVIVPDEDRVRLNYFLNVSEAMLEERVSTPVGSPSIVVRGTPEELQAVSELIDNIDRKLPQIMIDAKLVEINRMKTKDIGVSWFVGEQEGAITFGELSIGGVMERTDFISMRIQALEKDQLGRLVGNPRILTLSGRTAVINVGERVPYRNIERREDVVDYPLQWLDVGVKMGVTPELTPDGYIVLHVYPKVSTYTTREYVLDGRTFTDPQPSIKTADTTARLRDGETLVIGGLIKSSDIESITKIPLLSDIPIIGELFKLRSRTQEETELIIFLTPFLVDY